MQKNFQPPQGRPVGFIIIPPDYEDLPEERKKRVVPICIESHDAEGKAIAPVWFDEGVAPISEELTGLAESALGDRRKVSDIAQPSVHKLWRRNGCDAGPKPYARIWRQALWEARDQAAGGWRERRFRVVSRTLDELDREFPDRAADPRDYARLYEQQLLVGSVQDSLREEGLEEMARVYDLVKTGASWPEIGRELDVPMDALKRRFYRSRRKFRSE